MYQNPHHIVSSYGKNNIGKTLYDTVIKYKPKKIIDFGILYGYSTICLAQGVKDNGFGEVIAYDLFEDYPYKRAVKDVVLNNLKFYNLDQYVSLIKKDFNNWLYENEKFDLLHLDISNTGDTISEIYTYFPNSLVLFEGGTQERDNEEWMHKYNATPITSLQSKINYNILNPNWPGLSGYNL